MGAFNTASRVGKAFSLNSPTRLSGWDMTLVCQCRSRATNHSSPKGNISCKLLQIQHVDWMATAVGFAFRAFPDAGFPAESLHQRESAVVRGLRGHEMLHSVKDQCSSHALEPAAPTPSPSP